jgi:hypothetical protein
LFIPDPRSGPDFFTILDPGFLELRNHFWGVKILKFFDADPGSGSGMEEIRIRDGKKSDLGSGIRKNIPDPQHC